MKQMLFALLGSVSATLLGSAGGAAPRRFRSLGEVPWLAALQEKAVLTELQALADRDLNGKPESETFAADFGPNSDLAQQPGGWTALPLLNKGRLDAAGCAAAPLTCAALSGLAAHLAPRDGGDEVGVRVLKLAAGATLRPHVGPGGRLVAHLGLRVPPAGAALTVAGERVEWREGQFTIFDDSLLHSAENLGSTARYVLHVTFPLPREAAVVMSVSTQHAKLAVSSDCTVQVTNLRNSISSRPEPLAHRQEPGPGSWHGRSSGSAPGGAHSAPTSRHPQAKAGSRRRGGAPSAAN